jgi:hypothetical protein
VKIVGVIVLTLPAILRAQDGVAEKQNSRTTGKTAQSWRTVSSDLAKANEKRNQSAGN